MATDSIHKVPLIFLVEEEGEAIYNLHPLVKAFGQEHLGTQEIMRKEAHEKALDYYQPTTVSEGMVAVRAYCETGYHLLELDRHRAALEVLSTD
jgi:hypothetical protein